MDLSNYLRVWDIQEAEEDHKGSMQMQNVTQQNSNRGAIENDSTTA